MNEMNQLKNVRPEDTCSEGSQPDEPVLYSNKSRKLFPSATGRAEYILAAILVAASWFYIRGGEYFPNTRLPIFTALFLAAGCFYLRQSGRKMTSEERFYLALTAAGAGWYLLKFLPWQKDYFETQDIMPYVTLFLHGIGVYWVLTIGESRIDGCLDECGPWDLTRGFLVIPFTNFGKLFGTAASGVRKLRRSPNRSGNNADSGISDGSGSGGGSAIADGNTIAEETGNGEQKTDGSLLHTQRGQILLGLMFSVPVLMIVLPMLAGADDSFRYFMGNLTMWCGDLTDAFFGLFTFAEILWNLLVILAACYLFGLFYGAFYTKVPQKPGKTELPSAVLLTFSAVICGVYLLFFLVKFADAAGVFSRGQGEIVYSSYARQGFFELVFIAMINFCLFYFIKILSALEKPRIRQALTVLGIETLGFIVLAFSKMSLYISVYGFTFKRVFTSWFMCVLFVTFTLLIRAVWKKGNAIRLSVWFASVTFLMLAYSNPAWWIESLNACLQLGC